MIPQYQLDYGRLMVLLVIVTIHLIVLGKNWLVRLALWLRSKGVYQELQNPALRIKLYIVNYNTTK